MTKVKPLTAQKVHAVLRKAGHVRATYAPGTRRGHARLCDGYMLSDDRDNGRLLLVWHDSDYRPGNREVTAAARLRCYAQALIAVGIGCRVEHGAVIVPKGRD